MQIEGSRKLSAWKVYFYMIIVLLSGYHELQIPLHFKPQLQNTLALPPPDEFMLPFLYVACLFLINIVLIPSLLHLFLLALYSSCEIQIDNSS